MAELYLRGGVYPWRVPMYDWECGSCGQRFEAIEPAGTETTACRECGAPGAERRFSTFAYSRQPTPGQRRRMEDARGTNRDGARQRFRADIARRRERKGGG